MASDEFDISGPGWLIGAVDWRNEHPKRSVVASLVKAVYIREHDRLERRSGHQALAPRWWESLNFILKENLTDHSGRIFAAVYEYKYPSALDENVPKQVVAIRGTIKLLSGSMVQDMWLNFSCLSNKLHMRSRLQSVVDFVTKKVDLYGAKNLWLAGHSLGSAMALVAGKTMAEQNVCLRAYLFNPPYPSVHLEGIKNEKLKKPIRSGMKAVKDILAHVVDPDILPGHDDARFTALSRWIPYLFVNPNDPVCSEYCGYFRDRKIGSRASLLSLRSLVLLYGGKYSEAYRLLPSANLIVNKDSWHGFEADHGLQQWWNSDIRCESKRYELDLTSV